METTSAFRGIRSTFSVVERRQSDCGDAVSRRSRAGTGCALTKVSGLESLFGPRRRPEEPPDLARFADIAAGLQRRTEEAVLALARRLSQPPAYATSFYAGGVALNCISNARLETQRSVSTGLRAWRGP